MPHACPARIGDASCVLCTQTRKTEAKLLIALQTDCCLQIGAKMSDGLCLGSTEVLFTQIADALIKFSYCFFIVI